METVTRQVSRKGFQVTVGIILWEGGNIVKIPESEHPLLNGALLERAYGYGIMTKC